jgi:hypothetical protein
MRSLQSTKEKIGNDVRISDDRGRSPQGTDPGRSHRVERGDTTSILVETYYRELGRYSSVPTPRKAQALQLWLEDQGALRPGQDLSSLLGKTITLPSERELEAFFRTQEKLGRLSDGRGGDTTARRKTKARAVVDEGKPQMASLGQKRSSAARVGVRVGAERVRISRETPQIPLEPISKADAPEIPLEPIPKTGAAQVASDNKSVTIVDKELQSLCNAARVPKEVSQQILAFCAFRSVGTEALKLILKAKNYQGPELVHALKTAAIVVDAVENRLIEPLRLPYFECQVIRAIVMGRLHFATVDDMKAHAEYLADSNTVRFRKDGIDLGDTSQRGYVLHEMQHLVQDDLKQRGSTYEFEQEAHGVFAEYLLRSNGAITEEPDGAIKIDKPRLDRLMAAANSWLEGPDGFEVKRHGCNALIELLQRGGEQNVHHTEGASVEDLISAAKSELPKESFETVYLRAAMQDPKNAREGEEKVDAKLRTVWQKDGL